MTTDDKRKYCDACAGSGDDLRTGGKCKTCRGKGYTRKAKESK